MPNLRVCFIGVLSISALETVGEIFTSKEGRYKYNQMKALSERSINTLQVMAESCKEHDIELFWSLRMNDTHECFAEPPLVPVKSP